MKKNIKNELKNMGVDSLMVHAEEIRKELLLMRMKKFSSPEKNSALSRNLRKNLACTLTLVKERQLHGK